MVRKNVNHLKIWPTSFHQKTQQQRLFTTSATLDIENEMQV